MLGCFLRMLGFDSHTYSYTCSAGTGKSAIINDFLAQLPRERYVTCNISFSARTTSDQTQDIIFSKVER